MVMWYVGSISAMMFIFAGFKMAETDGHTPTPSTTNQKVTSAMIYFAFAVWGLVVLAQGG